MATQDLCLPAQPSADYPHLRGKAADCSRTKGGEMGRMIEFSRPDGGKTKGYLAGGEQSRPGIVVIQEWWGLNDQICGVADRFARAGYIALAPDLYRGRVVSTPDEANHLMIGLDFPDATHQDLRGAAQHLGGTSGKVAVLGFCMGGALTI